MIFHYIETPDYSGYVPKDLPPEQGIALMRDWPQCPECLRHTGECACDHE